jgi:hypothetical protein
LFWPFKRRTESAPPALSCAAPALAPSSKSNALAASKGPSPASLASEQLACIDLGDSTAAPDEAQSCGPTPAASNGLGFGQHVKDGVSEFVAAGGETVAGMFSLGLGVVKLAARTSVDPIAKLIAPDFAAETDAQYKQIADTALTLVKEPKLVWEAVTKDYVEAWEDGRYGAAIGRGVFDIGSTLLSGGFSKASWASKFKFTKDAVKLGDELNTLSELADASNKVRGRINWMKGELGEELVFKGQQQKVAITVNGRKRIPDHLDYDAGVIAEVKNKAKLDSDDVLQILDNLDIAEMTDGLHTVELHVRPSTVIPGKIEELYRAGRIKIRLIEGLTSEGGLVRTPQGIPAALLLMGATVVTDVLEDGPACVAPMAEE